MNGRRAVVGACMLCALLVSAFAAQGASAVTKGTTAFTCSSSASVKDFKTEHCKSGESGTAFGHVAIAQDTTTHITATSEKTDEKTENKTPHKLKSTINGIAFELSTSSVHAEGGMTNKKDPETGEHYIHGKNITLTYTEVVVSSPVGKGCAVYTDNGEKGAEGVVHTEPLTMTSAGQGDFVKFTPTEGEVFARFFVEGCKGTEALESLNGTYTVSGSLKCIPNGATITCGHNEVTTQGTLKTKNVFKAGYTGTITVKGAEEGQPTNPLSVTTVETA